MIALTGHVAQTKKAAEIVENGKKCELGFYLFILPDTRSFLLCTNRNVVWVQENITEIVMPNSCKITFAKMSFGFGISNFVIYVVLNECGMSTGGPDNDVFIRAPQSLLQIFLVIFLQEKRAYLGKRKITGTIFVIALARQRIYEMA